MIDADARPLGAVCLAVVDHAELQPQRRHLQADAVVDDRREVLGPAEDIDDVDVLAGCQRRIRRVERVGGLDALPGAEPRVDRNDAVAMALHRAGDAVTRSRGICRQAHAPQSCVRIAAGRRWPRTAGSQSSIEPLHSVAPNSGILTTMPRVVLVPTGEQFTAEPGEAVLTAALRAGLNLPHSCKGGHCGSCRARLLAGDVDYPWPRPAGISDEEIRDGFALLCQARARSDLRVEARAVRPAPDVEIRSLPCRAERLVRLTDDVMAVWLRLPAVETLPFRPGQYIDVMLPAGRRRSFSLANAPSDGALLELHVRRASQRGLHGAGVRRAANPARCCASRDRSGSSGCASSRRDRS